MTQEITTSTQVKVYVGNLNYDTTAETLKKEFAKFGEIAEIAIIPTKNYGFVKFNSTEEAENAVKELNGKKIDGRFIKVEISRPKAEKTNYRRNFRRTR